MRIAAVLLLLFLVDSSLPKPYYSQAENDTLAKYILKLLENFRASMPKGIPELQIPVLEPLNIPHINADVREGTTTIDLKFESFQIKGLSSFSVEHITADMNTFKLDITVKLAQVEGQSMYDMNGKIIGLFPIYGKGKAAARVTDLKIRAHAGIKIENGEKLQLTHFDNDISFSQVNIILENILGGGHLGNLINTLLNSLGKVLFDMFKPQIRGELNKIVLKELNRELQKVNLKDIIGGIPGK